MGLTALRETILPRPEALYAKCSCHISVAGYFSGAPLAKTLTIIELRSN
jgi:hypothetical protein